MGVFEMAGDKNRYLPPFLLRLTFEELARLEAENPCLQNGYFRQLLSAFGDSLALDEDVQKLTLTVDGAPEPVALPPNDDHHLVKMPEIAVLRAGAAQVRRNDRTELQEQAVTVP